MVKLLKTNDKKNIFKQTEKHEKGTLAPKVQQLDSTEARGQKSME